MAGASDERWFDNLHPALRRFWHPVAAAADVEPTKPHPFRLLGVNYVLACLDDAWTALPAVCPHRLAPLDAGTIRRGGSRGDVVVCGYHGWQFGGDGRCRAIPALGDGATIPPTAHLGPAHSVEERYGLVWVALDEPVAGIPGVERWDDPGLGRAPMPRQEWSAGAAQMVDNFLDVAHFPFTHLDTIGNPDEIEVHGFDIDRDDWRFDATYRHTARSLSESAAAGASEAAVVERTMRFRCWAPHHLQLLIDYGPDGDLLLLFFHQPIDAECTGLYCVILAENIADGRMTAAEQIDFQFRVAAEDRDMLERLPSTAVPLHPGVETHTRADRSTVEYRRLLTDVASLDSAALD
ncbi:MAG: Rieske 2Fe-2S domain-containing protein [Actinomycetota bacterium]